MPRKPLILSALSLACSVMGAGALAMIAPQQGHSLTRPEAEAGKLFSRLDANQDGVVTGEERAIGRARLACRWHQAMRACWQAPRAAGATPSPPRDASGGGKDG